MAPMVPTGFSLTSLMKKSASCERGLGSVIVTVDISVAILITPSSVVLIYSESWGLSRRSSGQ